MRSQDHTDLRSFLFFSPLPTMHCFMPSLLRRPSTKYPRGTFFFFYSSLSKRHFFHGLSCLFHKPLFSYQRGDSSPQTSQIF